jgi:plastocyanin
MRKPSFAFWLGMLVILALNILAQQPRGQVNKDEKRCSKTVFITIKNFKYNDGNPVTIQTGDSVVWINTDDMPHTATSTGESSQGFDTGILQPGDRSEAIVFLKSSGAAGIPYGCNVHDGMKGTLIITEPSNAVQNPGVSDNSDCDHHETPSVHSMVVTGMDSSSIFLHHIALFNDTNHFYHATFEAKLDDPQAQNAYEEFRKKNGDMLCILDPEHFLLPELGTGKRTSFKATFFQGKWESEIPGLKDVKVSVVRVIQFRRFDSQAAYPDRLTYQLYGNSKEVFLAHQVTAAPNFQEVVKLKEIPAFLTPELIKSSPLLIIPTKQLATSNSRTLRTAILSNGTHVVLSPPVGTLNPKEPLNENEEIEIQLAGERILHKIIVGRLIYFDVRIINE